MVSGSDKLNQSTVSSQIDKIDMRILSELDLHARQGLHQIAAKIRLSKQAAAYRIARLRELGVITGSYAVIDAPKLGFQVVRFYLALQDLKPDLEDEIRAFCASQENVGWLVYLHGAWDLAILLWVHDMYAASTFTKAFSARFGKHIRDQRVALVMQIHHLPQIPGAAAGRRDSALIFGKQDQAFSARIDDLDVEILRLLAQDGLMNSVQIGRMLHCSSKTVRMRIRELERTKLILGYRAQINTKKLGLYSYKVFLNLKDPHPRDELRFMTYLCMNPSVTYITRAIGMADVEFELMTRTPEEFYSLLSALRESFSGLIKTHESVMIMNEWGINYFPVPKRTAKHQ
jgi:DNA-binding Lrp family transcriptional regulator